MRDRSCNDFDDNCDDIAEQQRQQQLQLREIITNEVVEATKALANARTRRQVLAAGRVLERELGLREDEGGGGDDSDAIDNGGSRRCRRRLLAAVRSEAATAAYERIIKATAMTGLHHIALKLLHDRILPPNVDDFDEIEEPNRSSVEQQLQHTSTWLLPSFVAQDALCASLRKVGRLDTLQNVILRMGKVAKVVSTAARPSSSSPEKAGDPFGVSPVSFNIYLAALCDVATEKDTSPKYTNKSRAEILRDAADWLLLSSSSQGAEGVLRVQPDAVSYGTVLHAAATVGNQTLVDELWTQMLDRRIQPTTVAYNARLRLQTQKKKRRNGVTSVGTENSNATDAQMLRIWSELQKDPNVEPDRYTLDLMLPPLVRSVSDKINDGKVSGRAELERLLDRFLASNSEVVASDAFAAFLMSLTKGGELEAARWLFDTYLLPALSPVVSGEAGALRMVRPTSRHFNILLEGYRFKFVSGDRMSSYRPDAQSSDLDSSLPSEAWKLYDTMFQYQDDMRPTDYTISIMSGMCKNSEELSQLLRRAKLELGMKFGSAVVRSVITTYGRLGDPSSACWMFTRFSEDDDLQTERLWNVLLGALADKSLVGSNETLDPLSSSASQALGETEFKISNHDIFALLQRRTSPEAALEVLEYMNGNDSRHSRLQPNSQTYCLVATALQHSPECASPQVALSLFNKACKSGIPADGRFVNAIIRCFGNDIDSALSDWKSEIRPCCLQYENRPRRSPKPFQRTEGKNLLAAYHGLLYVSGRALRPEIALRLIFAMVKEGIEPNETSLRCYHSGKLTTERLAPDGGSWFVSRVRLKAYESLLQVECTKFDRNDKRRIGESRVRIIV